MNTTYCHLLHDIIVFRVLQSAETSEGSLLKGRLGKRPCVDLPLRLPSPHPPTPSRFNLNQTTPTPNPGVPVCKDSVWTQVSNLSSYGGETWFDNISLPLQNPEQSFR